MISRIPPVRSAGEGNVRIGPKAISGGALDLVADCENSRLSRHFLAQNRNLGYDFGDEDLDRREPTGCADERETTRCARVYNQNGCPAIGEKNFV
jgi:hypothetical protein